jgi:di/tricarboxylate transporter
VITEVSSILLITGLQGSWGILFSVLLLLVLLVQGRFTPVSLFTGYAIGYFLLGVVDESTFLVGFTNPALVTLLVLLMVSLVLERSPLVAGFSERVIRGGERAAIWRLSTLAAALSAFLNNTAVVGGLLGTISRQKHVAPSKLLIPLSYASILGGMTTLVGTSTNLVVNSLVVEAGLPALGLFQFSVVGVPVAMLCLVAIVLSSRWLPRHGVQSERSLNQYFLETQVRPDSPLIGNSIDANGLRNLQGLFLVEILRGGRLLSPVRPDELIEADDHLVFTGEVDKVQALQRFTGLQVFGAEHADNLLASNLMEVVLTEQSELVNKTLRFVDFRNLFDAGVVGIRRGERRLTGQLGRIELKVGDCLLLAVGQDFRQRKNLDRNFHLLSDEPLRPSLRPWENWLAIGGFATVIGVSALGWTPLLHGLLALLGVLVATRLLSPGELRRRFPFDLWLIVGSSLTIAAALESSGASGLIVRGIQYLLGDFGTFGALVGIYLLTWSLTELVTNNAAAALTFPIALSMAQSFGVDPLPFIMVVAYAASACFLLPFGYQTHLMVYSAGRYKTTDYLKAGWLVSLTYAAGVLSLVPLAFPFNP